MFFVRHKRYGERAVVLPEERLMLRLRPTDRVDRAGIEARLVRLSGGELADARDDYERYEEEPDEWQENG